MKTSTRKIIIIALAAIGAIVASTVYATVCCLQHTWKTDCQLAITPCPACIDGSPGILPAMQIVYSNIPRAECDGQIKEGACLSLEDVLCFTSRTCAYVKWVNQKCITPSLCGSWDPKNCHDSLVLGFAAPSYKIDQRC